MEKYIGKFKKWGNVVIETVYNSSEIKYFRVYKIGVSTNYSDHSALFVEHIFSNRKNSISEYNLFREYSSLDKHELKALEMLEKNYILTNKN